MRSEPVVADLSRPHQDGDDAEDGRQRVVRLTDHGWAAMAAMRKALECIERDWRRRLGAEVYDRLRQDLVALNQMLGTDVGRSP